MKRRPPHALPPLALAALLTLAPTAWGSELIYRPLNPSFGGNPNLSSHLINLAQIQNRFASNGGGGGVPQISFPPISIDLGGVGDALGGADTPTSPEAPDTTSDGTGNLEVAN